MTLEEAVQSRRSVRQFKTDPVAEDDVRKLLDLACAAPSAHNSRPWRFIVLRESTVRRRLAEAMAAARLTDAVREGEPPEEARLRGERSVARITQAPVVILACADLATLPPETSTRRHGERLLATQSVAAAVENLLLAAHAAGLGACWICAPAFCPQVVRATLDLADSWEPQALILIGYPAESPAPPQGSSAGEVVQWL